MSDMALVDWQRKAARQIRPSIRHPAGAGRALIVRCATNHALLVACVLAVGLVCLVVAVTSTTNSKTNKTPTVRAAIMLPAAWLDIIKPIEIFNLDAANLGKATKIYNARRSLDGGGRQDTLAFNTLTGNEPSLRLTVYRRGTEAYAPGPVFADIARLAAEAGLSVARSSLPDLMTTRFGPFQVADVALSAGGSPVLPCSGFRIVLDVPALTMTGLACGGKAASLTRERLGCVVERLDLASGGGDRPLVEFFAATELKRNAACAGMRLSPDGLHAAWLDDSSATPKKNIRRR